MKKLSVKEVYKIGIKYLYKAEVISSGQNACLSISEPLLDSPYPSNIKSTPRTARFVKRKENGIKCRYELFKLLHGKE